MTRFVRTTGFSRGEVDESLYDREDVEFYTSAARRMLNWFPDRIGGVRRRVPTQLVQTADLLDFPVFEGTAAEDYTDLTEVTEGAPFAVVTSTVHVVEFRNDTAVVEIIHLLADNSTQWVYLRASLATINDELVQQTDQIVGRLVELTEDVGHMAQEVDYAQIGPALFITSRLFSPMRLFFGTTSLGLADLEFFREMIGNWEPNEAGDRFEAGAGEAVALSEVETGDTVLFDRVGYEVTGVPTDERIDITPSYAGVRKIQTLSVKLSAAQGNDILGGNPRYVAANKGRLIFAATQNRPTGVWASKPNDPFILFGSTVFDDSPIDVDLLDAGLDEIRWMSGRDLLYIGGGQAEFAVGESDQPLTPSNFSARRVGSDGSRRVRPVQTGAEVYFVNEPGTQVMGVQFDFSTQGFISSDLSLLAPHLTAPKLRQLAFRPPTDYDRTPRMFFAKEDNQLCTLALDRAQDVVAWSSIQFPENVLIGSIAAGRELVFFQAQVGDRFVLAAFSPQRDVPVLLDLFQRPEVDAESTIEISRVYEGSRVTVVSSVQGRLDEFEIVEDQTSIDLSAFGDQEDLGDVTVGLRYRSEIEMLAGSYEFRNGTSLNRKRRLVRVIASLRDTREVTVQGQPILGQTPFSEQQIPPERTGQFERRLLGWSTDDAVTISVEGVYPATLLSVVREYST